MRPTPRDILHSLWVWGAAVSFTLLSSLVLLLLTPLPGQRTRGERVVRWWARRVLDIAGIRAGLEGGEKIPGGETCIFVANHQSMMDIPACMAKRSLFHIPIFGWLLYLEGFVPVDRYDPKRARESLGPAERRLRKGRRLFVFPEGTRSRTGVPGTFKSGAFRLSLKTGIPVIPLTIVGAEHVMAPRSKIVRPGPITIVVGDPIHPEDAKDRNDLRSRARSWIVETKARRDAGRD
jgi:1-acyl-sn-glycerol-3-phosphate acyltransferase